MTKKTEKKTKKPVKKPATSKTKATRKNVKKPAKKKPVTKKTKPVKRTVPARRAITPPSETSCSGWRVFTYNNDAENSHKFWQVRVDGNVMSTRWGRIGSKGEDLSTSFTTREAAMKAAAKKIEEKVNKKGYLLRARYIED